jgi:hypothetical protein
MNKKILGYINLIIAITIWSISIFWYKTEIILLILIVCGDLFFTIAIAIFGKKYLLKARRYFKIYWHYLMLKIKMCLKNQEKRTKVTQ